MKWEAEKFMIDECDALYKAILRPGLVYHQGERPWSMPLGLLSNLTHKVSGGQGPPGTNLRVLADITIREALKVHNDDQNTDEKKQYTIISAADMKTRFPL